MLRLKSPLTVQLELTNACNNTCVHCYNYLRYVRDKEKLAIDLQLPVSHFTGIAQKLADLDVRVMIITGGEPFFRRDALFPIARQAKCANMIVGINTNATMVAERDAKELKEIGVDFVLASLLSADRNTHNQIAQTESYDMTINGIRLLTQVGINVSVNMVVSQFNLADIRLTAKFVRDMRVKGFSATPAIACYLSDKHRGILLEAEQVKQVLNDLLWAKEIGLDVDVLEPLAHCMFNGEERMRFGNFLDHRSCSAGITEAAISPEGDVRPCIHADKVVGNILTDGWDYCWKAMETWTTPNILPQECLDCEVVDYCGGGCRMAALDKFGSISAKDPYMTEPLREMDQLAKAEKKILLPEDNDRIMKPDSFVLRRENFGGVVFANKRYIFLRLEPFVFLEKIVKGDDFSIIELENDFPVDGGELRTFIGILLARGFLIKKGGERRG